MVHWLTIGACRESATCGAAMSSTAPPDRGRRFCSDMHRYLARGRLIRLDVTEPEVQADTDPDDPKSRKFNRILTRSRKRQAPGLYVDRSLLS